MKVNQTPTARYAAFKGIVLHTEMIQFTKMLIVPGTDNLSIMDL